MKWLYRMIGKPLERSESTQQCASDTQVDQLEARELEERQDRVAARLKALSVEADLLRRRER